MKLNSRMHDWAAVNTWPRPSTNSSYGTNSSQGTSSVYGPTSSYGSRYGRYSVNIPVTTVVQPKLKMRRCHTTLMNGPSPTSLAKGQVYKPRNNTLQRESSTLDYIRYLKVSNKESEAKLNNTMHVLSVKKSMSGIDSRDTPVSMGGFNMGGVGMMRERSHVYAPSPSDQTRREGSSLGNKQEMKVGVAVVPRKGLISLSTNGETEQLPNISAYGENHRKLSIAGAEAGSGKKNKSLIKRKDIMDHFMAGFKRLEDEEQQKHHEEELQKSLGDYTIMDLQSKILQMTDAKTVKRPGHSDTNGTDSPSSMQHLKPEKTVLPAIKNLNPFTVK